MATWPPSTERLAGALVLGALLAAVGPGRARANMRALQVTPRAPSGALVPVTPAAVHVLGERLTFTCDDQACDVAAEYRVSAPEPANLTLAFIFRYEIWPLGEWQRARDFQVQGDVVISRPAPSWWQRIFHHVRAIGCRGMEPPAQHALQQRGDQLRFHFQLSEPLPKRLWCFIGDDDLVTQP